MFAIFGTKNFFLFVDMICVFGRSFLYMLPRKRDCEGEAVEEDSDTNISEGESSFLKKHLIGGVAVAGSAENNSNVISGMQGHGAEIGMYHGNAHGYGRMSHLC